MTSSTDTANSSLNEYETFADEVRDVIPEVDHRGRIQKAKSSVGEISSGLARSTSFSQMSSSTSRLDRSPTFWRSLLSTKTPYDEFHHLFKNVPKDQFPMNDFSCALSREILLQGRMYISQGWFCFYSNIFGWETQVTIDCTKVVSITREKTAYVVPNAILICTEDEKHFFSSFLSRETVYKLLLQVWEEALEKARVRNLKTSQISINDDGSSDKAGETEPQEAGNMEFDEEQDEEEEEEINANHKCQEKEGLDICFKCQENRQAIIIHGSKQNLDEMAKPNQVLTKCSSRDILSCQCTRKSSRAQEAARLGFCARLAVMLASLAEMSYSYVQVSIRLIRRLSSEQLLILIASFLMLFLTISSCFLFYRISILEPKILGNLPPEQISVHQSVKQILKLRQDVFNAEVSRFKTIIAANLEAITQVRETLKILQEDLAEQMKRNCTLLDDKFCVPI